MTTFRALLLEKDASGFTASVKDIDAEGLPASGDVLVKVAFSSLNYKDGLAICNRAPVVRSWPMVAGIDGAGTVESSAHPAWRQGDSVILNGFGAGESHWGCLAQQARLKGDWLVRLPNTLTLEQSMAIGTAGYTAMLACMALESHGIDKSHGPVLVTGAAGGVGSFALAILSAWGYQTVASTGRRNEETYLKMLGANEVIDRAELSAAGKPLQKERWAGVVDSVGSHTLANACAQTRYRGVVAACGLAAGMDFPATVAPFILRGVVLAGIDSVYQPLPIRELAWQKLAADLDRQKLAAITTTIGLEEAIDCADRLMQGKVRGRIAVDVNR